MSLEKKRKKIDDLDEKIVELLGERLELAEEIGKEKKVLHKEVYDPVREEQIIENLAKKGSFPKEGVDSIFREIFSVSRKAQNPVKVAYLGPETTFTHTAAMKQFGTQTEFEAKDSIKEVFSSVEKGDANYGVVPIENSLEGSVSRTYDRFLVSELNIVAEISLKIKHNLLSKHRLRDIKKIYTHPMALAQCREWISKNLPNTEILEVSSTAKGAESAGLYINSAGIGSELAAKKFDLQVIAENIQDKSQNFTRFLVIGKNKTKKSEHSKTSIVFSAKHEPGSLFTALEPLKTNKINMTKIESRPTRMRNWEYVFFVDFQGYIEDEKIEKALGEMKKNTSMLKILGSYPEKARFE